MTMCRITDAEVDAALRALVVEDESVRLEQRVLGTIGSSGTGPRASVRGPVPGVSWLPRAACAGGAVLALLLAIAVVLYRDVPLPAAPGAPALVIANSAEPLVMPHTSTLASAADVETASYQRVPRRTQPASTPLIDALAPPPPLEIERLHTPPLEGERIRIQALTVEPLSVPPLDGD